MDISFISSEGCTNAFHQLCAIIDISRVVKCLKSDTSTRLGYSLSLTQFTEL